MIRAFIYLYLFKTSVNRLSNGKKINYHVRIMNWLAGGKNKSILLSILQFWDNYIDFINKMKNFSEELKYSLKSYDYEMNAYEVNGIAKIIDESEWLINEIKTAISYSIEKEKFDFDKKIKLFDKTLTSTSLLFYEYLSVIMIDLRIFRTEICFLERSYSPYIDIDVRMNKDLKAKSDHYMHILYNSIMENYWDPFFIEGRTESVFQYYLPSMDLSSNMDLYFSSFEQRTFNLNAKNVLSLPSIIPIKSIPFSSDYSTFSSRDSIYAYPKYRYVGVKDVIKNMIEYRNNQSPIGPSIHPNENFRFLLSRFVDLKMLINRYIELSLLSSSNIEAKKRMKAAINFAVKNNVLTIYYYYQIFGYLIKNYEFANLIFHLKLLYKNLDKIDSELYGLYLPISSEFLIQRLNTDSVEYDKHIYILDKILTSFEACFRDSLDKDEMSKLLRMQLHFFYSETLGLTLRSSSMILRLYDDEFYRLKFSKKKEIDSNKRLIFVCSSNSQYTITIDKNNWEIAFDDRPLLFTWGGFYFESEDKFITIASKKYYFTNITESSFSFGILKDRISLERDTTSELDFIIKEEVRL